MKILSNSFKTIAMLSLFSAMMPIYSETIVDVQKSRIGFTAYSRIHDVDGQFMAWRFEGKIGDDFRGKGKIVIQLMSVNSGNQKRDKHLRDPDFFDIARFPDAVYHIDSTRLTSETLEITGRLSLHGVEKPINLNLQRKKDALGWVLVGETILHQKDFGMVYSSLINPVKSEVRLKFHIVLVKK